jgi:membrane fusion protein (multidrug efflux system)
MSSEYPQEPTDTDRHARLRRAAPALAVGGVAVAILIGWAIWHSMGRVSTDDARIDGHVSPVAARIGGPVLEVHARDNQQVAAGDLLVLVDPRDATIALHQAEADFAAADAAAHAAEKGADVTRAGAHSRLAEARSGESAARARLAAAQAREQEAGAQAERTAKDLARLEPLLAKDEVSHQEYDALRAAARAAAAALDAARAGVTEAERGLEAARAQLAAAATAPEQIAADQARAAAARARAAQAQAALEQARTALADTRVVAPVAGVVASRSVEPGQVIAPGQPLLALVDLEDVWVVAEFKESQLEGMRPGQPVEIRVDAFPGHDYRGHVDSVAPATSAQFSLLPPENATGNFVKVVQRVPVKIVFEPGQNDDHRLRPGLSVVPTVRLRAGAR